MVGLALATVMGSSIATTPTAGGRARLRVHPHELLADLSLCTGMRQGALRGVPPDRVTPEALAISNVGWSAVRWQWVAQRSTYRSVPTLERAERQLMTAAMSAAIELANNIDVNGSHSRAYSNSSWSTMK